MTEKWRYWAVIGGLLIAFLGLVWRMVDLMVIDHTFLQDQGNARSIRIVDIPAYRGMITDRNGEPLAVSTPVDSVWIDPKQFIASAKELNELAGLVGIAPDDIQSLVDSNKQREFIYLKRGMNPYVGPEVKDLNIPGVFIENEFRRFYPEGEIAAQLVGLTNIDDIGQEGEELAFNQWLSGIDGKKRVLQDRMGRIIADVDLIQAPQPGRDLTLSIDRRIQYLAYLALQEQVASTHADSGSLVVLDVKTGEVLAMASVPSYNPNDRPKIHDGRFRNRAATDVFEPGSTMKPFSVSNALMTGNFTPNTIIDTNPGYIIVDNRRIDDDDNYGVLTVTGVLQKSSNVGVTKMTLTTPPTSLYNLLHKVGFGQTTSSGFPGESPGILENRARWSPISLATISFGYGVSVTDLQLAQAYSILANGGIKKPVSLVKVNNAPVGERVMPQKIAHEVLMMLETVVEKGGTATQASIPGYTVAGKTGTSRIIGPNGYELNHHTAVFAGIAPVSNPRLVVVVMIRDPKGTGAVYYMGGEVSAPVFAKVMGGALRLLDVPPDDLNGPAQGTVSPAGAVPTNQ